MAEIGSSPSPSPAPAAAPASRPEPAAAPAASPSPASAAPESSPSRSTRDTASVTPEARSPERSPSAGTRSLLGGLADNFGGENGHDIDMVRHTQARLGHTASRINDPATTGAERRELLREQAQLRQDLLRHQNEQPRGVPDPNAPSTLNTVARGARSVVGGAVQGVEDTLGTGGRLSTLRDIDEGRLTPDPDSRLGAYHATRGFREGTVGNSVHNAIGTIYAGLGTVGEERIGTVFNSPEARALYNEPVNSQASRRIAEMEHAYWSSIRQQNPLSVGGNLGSAVPPGARDFLQQQIFR